MKLYMSPRAPNPRRVQMFIAEKAITGITEITVDLNGLEHKTPGFIMKNPMARIPILELDDGRHLSETRAICGYLEGITPAPNLMGETPEARAFIEMADRHMEFYLLLPLATWIRHTHPGLATLEVPQFPDYGAKQFDKFLQGLAVLESRLATQAFIAGDAFSIADITAFCGIEFTRLMKFKPAEAGFTHVQAWRDRIGARPSAKV
ncbi:MAG: glutathione S-transferase [Acidocella sp.]|nr:glutathione S-transferase [Acidocella sp.]